MVMQIRGDKCYPGRGIWVKIPLLPENVGKRSLNYLRTLGTLERVTTMPYSQSTSAKMAKQASQDQKVLGSNPTWIQSEPFVYENAVLIN